MSNTNKRIKKGVSPLIATVLLVAFAVAIGAVVSNYVIQKTKEFKPEKLVEDSLLCDEVSLGYSIDPPDDTLAKDWLCIYNDNILSGINLVNKGKFSIYKYSINIQGRSNPTDDPAGYYESTIFKKYDTGLKPGKKQQIFFGINNNNNKIIKVVPIIKNPEVENEFVKCAKSALVIDYDKLCREITGDNNCNDCGNGINLNNYKTIIVNSEI